MRVSVSIWLMSQCQAHEICAYLQMLALLGVNVVNFWKWYKIEVGMHAQLQIFCAYNVIFRFSRVKKVV